MHDCGPQSRNGTRHMQYAGNAFSTFMLPPWNPTPLPDRTTGFALSLGRLYWAFCSAMAFFAKKHASSSLVRTRAR